MKCFTRVFLFVSMLLILAGPATAASAEHRPDLPDTVGFARELATFANLEPDLRQAQIAESERLVDIWLKKFEVKDGEVKWGLYGALGSECFSRLNQDALSEEGQNVLGEALTDLERAVALDPTQVVARTALGMVFVETGRQRAGIVLLDKALAVLDSLPAEDGSDLEVRNTYLRRQALYFQAMGYRDCGLSEQAMATVDAGWELGADDRFKVLKGLCLAASGRTSEAISYAVRMEPIEFRHRTALSSGWSSRPSDYANRWIKSQALLAAGDAAGALHILGDLKTHRARRLMPLQRRFWQDAGLVCELLQDPEARTHYNMVSWNSYLGLAYPSDDRRLLTHVVLDYPSNRVPVFITPDQSFKGGSPFAYIATQLGRMADSGDQPKADQARDRALDRCESLLQRHIQPDLVRAFRARIHLADGRRDLARPDLEFARTGFASRGLVDPGTSILLGQLELEAGNNKRSEKLFDEALAEVPDNAMAWRKLGVALGRAREFELAQEAMDKAVELEPESLEGWYNLGVLAYRQGFYKQALLVLEKAWALEPGNERVQTMLQTVAAAKRAASRGEGD